MYNIIQCHPSSITYNNRLYNIMYTIEAHVIISHIKIYGLDAAYAYALLAFEYNNELVL